MHRNVRWGMCVSTCLAELWPLKEREGVGSWTKGCSAQEEFPFGYEVQVLSVHARQAAPHTLCHEMESK